MTQLNNINYQKLRKSNRDIILPPESLNKLLLSRRARKGCWWSRTAKARLNYKLCQILNKLNKFGQSTICTKLKQNRGIIPSASTYRKVQAKLDTHQIEDKSSALLANQTKLLRA